MGRLFDAVAAICGLAPRVTYEGQAAIELEAACDPQEHGRYPILVGGERGVVIDARPTIRAVAADIRAGAAGGVVASRFHAAMADATVRASTAAAGAAGTETVVLSGGVFQNRRLLEASIAGLLDAGLRVLVPERLPIGDGGISFGQAAIAARRQRRDRRRSSNLSSGTRRGRCGAHRKRRVAVDSSRATAAPPRASRWAGAGYARSRPYPLRSCAASALPGSAI